ncbi:glycosyltransferase [Cellulomonas bogoriensis]|uniref:glycosyltransferase n=1 Tax=Cellulomonas bogoriensis TaxID=301388 RepID=UPI0018DD4B0F|nr:glycosyltransferase [Cellulomonas bogoriensis]
MTVRDIFASAASGGRYLYRDIAANPDLATTVQDHDWLRRLARVTGLQAIHTDDIKTARHLLNTLIHSKPSSDHSSSARLLAELSLQEDDFHAAWNTLENHLDTTDPKNLPILADLVNPYTPSPYADRKAWLTTLNRIFFGARDQAVDLAGTSTTPFNLLCSSSSDSKSGPLVSVIITTYNPDIPDLDHSLRSIERQTWRNLEILVIDDGSTKASHEALRRLVANRDRVRLLTLPENSGTYVARNLGLTEARGDYVTGQDADDWSHCERITRQVRHLETHARTPAVLARAVFASPSMRVSRPGYPAIQRNTSSLLLRRHVIDDIGAYVPSRKGADTEYLLRIEASTGESIAELTDPAGFVRVNPRSLSRSDFKPGWSHPARRSFRSAYTRWHASTSPHDLKIQPEKALPFQVPAHLASPAAPVRHYDIIYAGDWTSHGGPQESMLAEIEATQRAGMTAAILNLEVARFASTKARPLSAVVQDKLNSGDISQVELDDHVEAQLLLVRYPPTMQFASASAARIRARRVIIVANQAPTEADGSDRRYSIPDCHSAAERLFQSDAFWIPQGPVVRDQIREHVPYENLIEFDLPGVIDTARWHTSRTKRRSDRPVIGRHSRDNPMKWPEDRASILSAYPTSGEFDVRVLGGAATPMATLGLRRIPPAWLVFPKNEIPAIEFLRSLDFFVYHQHSRAIDAFGRAVLEAIASGTVPIVDQRYEPTFGEAAIYAHPSECGALVEHLHADPKAYGLASERAQQYAHDHFGLHTHVERLSRLMR